MANSSDRDKRGKHTDAAEDAVSERLIRAEFSGFVREKRPPQPNERGQNCTSEPPSDKRPTIVIADDYKPIRDAISALVRADFDVVAEADNGYRALHQCLEAKPAIAILDIQMPVMSGFQVARELKRQLPATYIVFVSQHSSEYVIVEA